MVPTLGKINRQKTRAVYRLVGCSLYSVYLESPPLRCWECSPPSQPPLSPSCILTSCYQPYRPSITPYHLQALLLLLPHHLLPTWYSSDFQIRKLKPHIYSLVETIGCVQWFLPCLYWRWQSECRKTLFLFKLSPGGGTLSDEQMRKQHW